MNKISLKKKKTTIMGLFCSKNHKTIKYLTINSESLHTITNKVVYIHKIPGIESTLLLALFIDDDINEVCLDLLCNIIGDEQIVIGYHDNIIYLIKKFNTHEPVYVSRKVELTRYGYEII